jgi:hypothetical protein
MLPKYKIKLWCVYSLVPRYLIQKRILFFFWEDTGTDSMTFEEAQKTLAEIIKNDSL